MSRHPLIAASAVVVALTCFLTWPQCLYLGTKIAAHHDPYFSTWRLAWLVKAQQENGGWGGGSHARQDVRDPHGVPTDPGTTAFSAMALLRAGYGPGSGEHGKSVTRAIVYVVEAVEKATEDGPRITEVKGTQPQIKLGANVDTSLAAQLLSRALPRLERGSELARRAGVALDKCVRKLERSQAADGSWKDGGWAPVHQSSMANAALEGAAVAGRIVDAASLEKSRSYQQGNFDERSGRVRAGEAAGVELYALSGAQRASAPGAKAAYDALDQAKREGKLAQDAKVDEGTLTRAGFGDKEARDGAKAVRQSEKATERLQDPTVLAGFGNNGGEEFLSYMLASESLVVTGGEPWTKWNAQMHERLAKIQNGDGSWSGHHCISSPVFCTAAVVLCLNTERDAELLARAAPPAKTQPVGVKDAPAKPVVR